MLDPVDVLYFKLAVGSDRIKSETPVDIAARCPICGDSKHSKNKARLHLYEKNGKCFVNCFNECTCVNKTVTTFLREYYPNLYDSYRKEKFSDTLKKLKEPDIEVADLLTRTSLEELNLDSVSKDVSKDASKDASKDVDVPAVCNFPLTPPILFELNCFEQDEQKISNYFKNRGITYRPDVIGSVYNARNAITIDNKKYPLYNYLIIPFYKDNKWYGFYSRSFDSHRFLTYIPSKNSGFKIWNLYNVDINKTVYIFEGIFDALSAYECGITNVVACCGATPSHDILKEFKDAVFCLDNDTTGITNSVKYLKNGYKVVNWQNRCKDCNEMLLANIDVKREIHDNIVNGILGVVKLQSKL